MGRLSGTAAVPVVAPSEPGGNYPDAQSIALSSSGAGTIYYTLDGTDSATSGTRTQYNAPIPISETSALKHYASDVAGNVSTVQTEFCTIYSFTNSWTQKTDFVGMVRSYAVGFSIGNKGYIATGWDGTSYCKDFWEYDPALDTWTRKADFAGAARFAPVGFSIGNKGYGETGLNGASYYKDFWEFDPGTYIPLYAGWNFIFLPLTPPDTTIGQVLSPLSSKAVIVWGYDNTK